MSNHQTPPVVDLAQSDAARILSEYWRSKTTPVNTWEIAGKLGITVLYEDFPENVSGALIKAPGVGPYIVLRDSDHPRRQSFTLAHELGHFVRNQKKEEVKYIDLRDPISSEGSDEDEIYANNFAANLLMPKDRVVEFYQATAPSILLPKSKRLSPIFGVSEQAMAFRLKNLGLEE